MRKPGSSGRLRVAVLLGPTGVGKTELALRLAQDVGMDILSCDSRQIYRGMDIGTAKPSPEQRARVKHWLIDIVDPSVFYSAYDFAAASREILWSCHRAGRRVIICGGTGLYFKCLSEGMGPHIPSDAAFREQCRERVKTMGEDSIFIELATVDPSTAKRIHPKDLTRVIRALEIFHTTGVPASEFKRCTRPSDEFEFCVTIASLPRSVLYDRINKRVDAMAASGLWDEFRSLRSSGFDERSPGMLAVGYRELFDVERNVRDFGQALNAIKADTRRYAKRQITWFTHQAHGVNEDVSVDRYDAIRTRIHDFLAAV